MYVCELNIECYKSQQENIPSALHLTKSDIICVYVCMYVLLTVQGSFNRICCALNSLAKNHSLSKAPRRQLLISKLTPLQVSLTLSRSYLKFFPLQNPLSYALFSAFERKMVLY